MLRYQLNPHFMFNTMNAISTLIYKKDNEKAGEMLDQLCSFFRYSLDQKADQDSTLKKELELLDLYLSIEKVRFGERLQIHLDVDTDLLKAKVPSMFLQPIVENAIKYGVEARKSSGTIYLEAKLQQGRLVVAIKDEGTGEQTDQAKQNTGFGIGLNNTRERLATMFNKQSTLTINHQRSRYYGNGGIAFC